MKKSLLWAPLALAGSLALAMSAIAATKSPYTPGLGNDTSTTPSEEFKRGVAELNAKNYPVAIRAFEAVLAAVPDDAQTWVYKAMAENLSGQTAAAQASLKRAVRADGSNINAHFNLAMVDIKLNQKPGAQDELKVLQTLATKCNNTCPDAATLKQAVEVLTGALAQ